MMVARLLKKPASNGTVIGTGVLDAISFSVSSIPGMNGGFRSNENGKLSQKCMRWGSVHYTQAGLCEVLSIGSRAGMLMIDDFGCTFSQFVKQCKALRGDDAEDDGDIDVDVSSDESDSETDESNEDDVDGDHAQASPNHSRQTNLRELLADASSLYNSVRLHMSALDSKMQELSELVAPRHTRKGQMGESAGPTIKCPRV